MPPFGTQLVNPASTGEFLSDAVWLLFRPARARARLHRVGETIYLPRGLKHLSRAAYAAS